MSKNDKHKDDDVEASRTFEDLGRKIDQRPEVQAAAEALRVAQAQFEEAKRQYVHLRDDATKEAHKLHGKNVGDVISGVLELVRKYPAPGVLAAVAAGWFAGRIFRR